MKDDSKTLRRLSSSDTKAKESKESRLLKLVEDAELFVTEDGTAYISLVVADHQETHPITSGALASLLRYLYYGSHKRVLGRGTVENVISTIKAQALFGGQQKRVYLRVGRFGDTLLLDLANNRWECIAISAKGWWIEKKPPVRFRRSEGMLPLPYPAREGDGEDLFMRMINVRSLDDLILIEAWLLGTLYPEGPYPVLVFNSDSGTAKSTQSRILRGLIDPNIVPLHAIPKDERDLLISATNSHVLAYDNISYIANWHSNAFCRLSTGGGLSTRRLYTDDEEKLLRAQRPVILNGVEQLVRRHDLLDRAIVIPLPRIPDHRRVPEERIWTEFDRYHPRVLGWLLDILSASLLARADLAPPSLPRMADFVIRALSADDAMGWPSDRFIRAFTLNRQQSHEGALGSSAIADHLRAIGAWKGTATKLLRCLNNLAGDREQRAKSWPGSARALARELRRIAPSLLMVGLRVTFTKKGGGNRDRMIELEPSETWLRLWRGSL
jgi:hypothetical protein